MSEKRITFGTQRDELTGNYRRLHKETSFAIFTLHYNSVGRI
jgi:hypothetical protein